MNFYANTNGYAPLVQSLTASSAQRTNVLENFFILSRDNVNGSPTWIGVGYAVDTDSPDRHLFALPLLHQLPIHVTRTRGVCFT